MMKTVMVDIVIQSGVHLGVSGGGGGGEQGGASPLSPPSL